MRTTIDRSSSALIQLSEIRPFILIDSRIIGGPGKGIFQFIQHARRILGGRFQPTVARFTYEASPTEFAVRARAEQVPLVEIPCRGIVDRTACALAAAVIRARRSTLIQSHGYKSHLYAWLLARTAGLPWLAFAHGWTAENRRMQLYHQIDRLLLPRAGIVAAVSPPLQRTIGRWRTRSGPTELVMNAVDPAEATAPATTPHLRETLPPHTVLLGCIGRLSREKGQAELLAAFRHACSAQPKAHLVLIGSGPDEERLRQIARDLIATRRVTLLPHQTDPRTLYAALDIVAIPSLSEGLPNVLLEAMSYGRPIVATTVGAIPEVVHDGVSALLVPPGNLTALGSAISRLVASAELRRTIGAGGRAALDARFSPAERTRHILDLYHRITTPLTLQNS